MSSQYDDDRQDRRQDARQDARAQGAAEMALEKHDGLSVGGVGHAHPNAPLGRMVDYVIIAVGIRLSVLLFLLYGEVKHLVSTQAEVQQTQAEGRERTFRTQAVQCDLIKGIGITEPINCSVPDVAQYRDPSIVEGSSASARQSKMLREVICQVLRRPDSGVVVTSDLCPSG